MTCDSRCGCERSLAGQDSGKGTTVADRDVTEAQLRGLVDAHARAGGWGEFPDVLAEFQAALDAALAAAAGMPVGAHVRVRHAGDAIVITAAD